MVALGAIIFLSSSERRTWLQCQFMSESSAREHLEIAISKKDASTVETILKAFAQSSSVSEYLGICMNAYLRTLAEAPEVVLVILKAKGFDWFLDGEKYSFCHVDKTELFLRLICEDSLNSRKLRINYRASN